MDRKKILIALLIIVLLIVLGAVKFMLNPLTKSEEQIRDKLLEDSPIGTHMKDVIKYIEGQRNWVVRTISYDHGFYHQRVYPNRTIGEKSIRVEMGDYGFFLTTSVTVFWGFDENSELIDIWVWKTVDAF
jgi:hypothetical protein